MTRDRMDNTAFEGGEAVLLAARGLPNRDVISAGGGHSARGGRRPPGERAGGGGSGGSVAVEMGSRGEERHPSVTQTNGGPNCHCGPQEDRAGGDYREDSKSPTNPTPIVAQESPWHRKKSIYLGVIVALLVIWVITYTILSELSLL